MYTTKSFGHVTVPWFENLCHEIQPGQEFIIQGLSNSSSKMFTINLALGPILEGPHRSDIAFHFNPRYTQNYVARNTFRRGSWDGEEGSGSFPFSKNVPFIISILVREAHFQVEVDMRPFITFGHRIPIKEIKTLQIHGDIYVTNIQVPTLQHPVPYPHHVFQVNSQYGVPICNPPVGPPPAYEAQPSVPSYGGTPSGPAYGGTPLGPAYGGTPSGPSYGGTSPAFAVAGTSDRKACFAYTFPVMSVGKTISISGRVLPAAEKFSIALFRNSPQRRRKLENIHLCLQVNFNHNRHDARKKRKDHRKNVITTFNSITLASKLNKKWGKQEQTATFPFLQGGPFDITFGCEEGRFVIQVNNSFFTDFIHKLPYHTINEVTAKGDVQITSISIK